MDLSADEIIEKLFNGEAFAAQSDDCKPNELELKLPPWYDEEKFKRGQKFFQHNLFTMFVVMLTGLVTVLAIPSIIALLIDTRRSSSAYTAYKRYVSTTLHVVSWLREPLEPGSVSWKSLHAVRSRHLRATIQCNRKSKRAPAGITQRDIAFTMFGFMGYAVTKGKLLNIEPTENATMDDLVHAWAVIGHMIGQKEEYNICRPKLEDTLKICKAINDRVCAPCLQNVPEHFVHMTDAFLDGMWSFNPSLLYNPTMFYVRYLADVPGYVFTKEERMNYKKKLLTFKFTEDQSATEGTSSKYQPASEDTSYLPALRQPRHDPRDFDSLSTVPAYKRLSLYEKYRLNLVYFIQCNIMKYNVVRLYLNFQIIYSIWLIQVLPFLAFIRYGIHKSYINMFKDSDMDDTVPKKNSEMVVSGPWYEKFLPFSYYSDYISKQL